MAQTKKKRRRKHRGTQGGRIDTRPQRGRAKRKKPGERVPSPPSWSSALKKGGVAAVLFLGILALMGQDPVKTVIAAVLLGLAFYVPMAYWMDSFFYRRHLRKEAQKRAEREAQRAGGAQHAEG